MDPEAMPNEPVVQATKPNVTWRPLAATTVLTALGLLSLVIAVITLAMQDGGSMSLGFYYLFLAEPLLTMASALLLWNCSRLMLGTLSAAIALQIGNTIAIHPEILQSIESMAERFFIVTPPAFLAKVLVSLAVLVYALFLWKQGRIK